MDPHIINFPKVIDDRGNLSFFESQGKIPFQIERVYWIYDVPGGEARGGHAYFNLEEVIVSLSGSFDVVINDGFRDIKFSLNRSNIGLYVPSMYWRELENFSTNSVALIAASKIYCEKDYIRDFRFFQELILKS